MAQSAKIGSLTDELITTVTGISAKISPKKFAHCRDLISRHFRHHIYGRTDQFDVKSRFDGLEERFSILNRDDLADALHDRLEELSRLSNRWTPETLSLLLQLADKPTTKSSLESLELLRSTESPLSLTWKEIIQDDPLDEIGIWDSIDYAAESEDESDLDLTRDLTFTTNDHEISRLGDKEGTADLDSYIVPVHTKGLRDLKGGQFWTQQVPIRPRVGGVDLKGNGPQASIMISELQAVREVLFMLCGLPTSLFRSDTTSSIIRPEKAYGMRHCTQQSLLNLLDAFAVIGKELNELRKWAHKEQSVPLLQVFRAAVEDRLSFCNMELAKLQSRFLGSDATVVSLLQVYDQLQPIARPLHRLSSIVKDLEYHSTDTSQPFIYLELIFNQICSNQMTGDDSTSEFMAKLFFECFQVYLRPIRNWMRHGELRDDDDSFFIASSEGDAKKPASVWHDHYVIRQSPSGRVLAPNFLHAASKKILNTGKSVLLLDLLGVQTAKRANEASHPLNIATVLDATPLTSLVPFSEAFDTAFDDWVEVEHQSASTMLRDSLFTECGLWRSLDALEYIFFFRDGSLADNFGTTIFNKIDRGKEAWNDQFLLTEHAQGVFGILGCIDGEKLVVRALPRKYGDMQSKRRSVKVLADMVIEYTLPWPVLNIIQQKSLSVYQRVATFLLQIRRAKHVVERFRLLKEDIDSSGDEAEHDLSYAVRHRLLWLTNSLYTYTTETVITLSTESMRRRLSEAQDLDDMVEVHEKYIQRIEAQCLLSKRLAPIYQAIISLLDLAILFSDAHSLYAGEQSFDVTNRSFSLHNTQMSASSYKRRQTRDEDADMSSSDDEDEAEAEVDMSYISFIESPYMERLKKMRAQFEQLLGFVTAGLRGVARAGGETSWETLAEKLEWGRAAGAAREYE